MIKKLFVISLLCLGCMALSGPVWADSVSITNSSFEIANPLNLGCGTGCAFNPGPVPGWTTTSGGTWKPGAYFPSVPDGSLIGYANAGSSISQTLSDSVLANSFYTLSAFVGNRGDQYGNGTFTIFLDTILNGNTTTLCSFTGSASGIAAGTFQDETCSFSSGSIVPTGNLFLQFSALTGQLDIDNVSLTVRPVVNTPEPGSVGLLGMGALFLLAVFARRQRRAAQSLS